MHVLATLSLSTLAHRAIPWLAIPWLVHNVIAGRPDYAIFQSKQSVTIAHKLLNVDKVDAISGIYCNHALLPAGPVSNSKGIPAITTGSTTGDVTGIGAKIFRLFPADQFALAPLIPYIMKHHSRLCMVTSVDSYTELMQRIVKKMYAEKGLSDQLVAHDVEYSVQDFRGILLKGLAQKCDAFYLNSPGDDAFITMFKQLRHLNKTVPVYAVYNPGSNSVIAACGNLLNGVIYSDLPSREALASPLGRDFLNAYEARFGQFKSSQPLGLLALEALRLFLSSIQSGTPVDMLVRDRTITDGAIKPYRFDGDGAIEGISFRLLRHSNGENLDLGEAP